MRFNKIRKIFIVIVSIAIGATLAFIWVNSMFSQTESAKESSAVYETVKPALDVSFGKDKITHSIFRKMAHATEFFVLGAEVCLLFVLLRRFCLKSLTVILPIGFAVGGIDEIIQLFFARGSAFKDVLIDFSGFCAATLIASGLYYSISAIVKRNKKSKQNKSESA